MPSAKILGPLLDLEPKKVLVKEITDAMEKAFKIPRDNLIVLIQSIQPDNLGKGGILLSERIA